MSSIFLFSTSHIFLPDICAQPFHAFCRMRKKHPVCRTQLIQPRLSIHKRLAPSAAAASAQRKIRTFMTGCTDRSGSLHKCFCFFRSLGQFTRNYTQTVKRAADNKRRYAPGWVHSTCLLRGFPKGAAPHLAHDFAEQSVVCYTLCRRCPENTVAAGEGKGI